MLKNVSDQTTEDRERDQQRYKKLIRSMKVEKSNTSFVGMGYRNNTNKQNKV